MRKQTNTATRFITVVLAIFLSACNMTGAVTSSPTSEQVSPATGTPTPRPTSTLLPSATIQPTLPPSASPTPTPEPAVETSVEDTIMERSNTAITALKNFDLGALAALVHPTKGVRFSPYSYVADDQLVFTADGIMTLGDNQVIYTWGISDGSGKPIELSFRGYYEEFIYDVDFANAEQIAYNEALGMGNMIDNSRQFYPEANFVEYYFPGFDPNYEGMDWRSLRLVFEQEGETWYLVGVIHGEWTI